MSFKIEIGALSRELNQKLSKSADELISQIQSLNGRLDDTLLKMTYQQAQKYISARGPGLNPVCLNIL